MNTRSATLNSSLITPSPIVTKIEKEVMVKKRQRYIWPEAQFVRLMHRFRCEVRVAYQNREVDGRSVLELMTLEAPKARRCKSAPKERMRPKRCEKSTG
jgi:hypothetical protein